MTLLPILKLSGRSNIHKLKRQPEHLHSWWLALGAWPWGFRPLPPSSTRAQLHLEIVPVKLSPGLWDPLEAWIRKKCPATRLIQQNNKLTNMFLKCVNQHGKIAAIHHWLGLLQQFLLNASTKFQEWFGAIDGSFIHQSTINNVPDGGVFQLWDFEGIETRDLWWFWYFLKWAYPKTRGFDTRNIHGRYVLKWRYRANISGDELGRTRGFWSFQIPSVPSKRGHGTPERVMEVPRKTIRKWRYFQISYRNLAGWWYTYPSEKYESQLRYDYSQYMEK